MKTVALTEAVSFCLSTLKSYNCPQLRSRRLNKTILPSKMADYFWWYVILLLLIVHVPHWLLFTTIFHCSRSCTMSIMWRRDMPVHSLMSSIHDLLGRPLLYWSHRPTLWPSVISRHSFCICVQTAVPSSFWLWSQYHPSFAHARFLISSFVTKWNYNVLHI
jgi:hypothetical protein